MSMLADVHDGFSFTSSGRANRVSGFLHQIGEKRNTERLSVVSQ